MIAAHQPNPFFLPEGMKIDAINIIQYCWPDDVFSFVYFKTNQCSAMRDHPVDHTIIIIKPIETMRVNEGTNLQHRWNNMQNVAEMTSTVTHMNLTAEKCHFWRTEM